MKMIVLFTAILLALSAGSLGAEKSPCGHAHGETPVPTLAELLSRDGVTRVERRSAMECLAHYGQNGFKILLQNFDVHLEKKDNSNLIEDLNVLGRIADRAVALRILSILDADVELRTKKLAIPQLRNIVKAGVTSDEFPEVVTEYVKRSPYRITIYTSSTGRGCIIGRGSPLKPSDLHVIKRTLTRIVQREHSDGELVAEASKTLESITDMEARLERAITRRQS